MEKLMILHLVVDGEVYQTVSVEKGEPVLVSPPPEKEGYTFERWDGLPERGIAGKEVKATALYTKNEYEVTFKLDGEIVSSEKLPYASVIALPAVSGGTACPACLRLCHRHQHRLGDGAQGLSASERVFRFQARAHRHEQVAGK